MADAKNGTKPDDQIKKTRAKRVRPIIWAIGKIKRKLHNRKAKEKKGNPTDQAAQRTAAATVWIAFFTVVLAIVGGITLFEVISGGTDTHDLAVAAKKQAAASVQQVGNFAALAIAAKIQSDNTVQIAQAAIDQAEKLAALEKDTIAQNRVLSDQLDAMNRSMALSEKQSKAALDASTAALQFDQRPWVNIETVEIVDKWYWEPVNKAYMIKVAFTVKNTGKTPALGVWISPYIVPSAWMMVDVDAAQKQACQIGDFPSFTLFSKAFTSTIDLSLSQTDIDESNRSFSGPSIKPEQGMLAKIANPGLVGCVSYYSGFSTVRLQTGFSYDLRLNEKAGGVGGPAFIPLDKQDIPGARFFVMENPLGGNWAK